MQKILIILTTLSLFLIGCAHKIEIQQGNVVTTEQLAQLKAGMDRRQVRALLGTPLLADPFHPQRWDYYYSDSIGHALQKRYHLTLFFKGELLERYEKSGEFPVDEYQKIGEMEKP